MSDRGGERLRDAAGNTAAQNNRYRHGKQGKCDLPQPHLGNRLFLLLNESVHAPLAILQIFGNRGLQSHQPGEGFIPDDVDIDAAASLNCLHDPIVQITPGYDCLVNFA